MTEEKFKILPWQGTQEPEEENIREIYRKEGLDPYSWSNGAGERYSLHTHPYHKVLYVVSGSITFGFPEDGKNVTMNSGDRLELSPGVAHDAIVGSEGVFCLEAHRSE